jgi:ABC-three component (ABC-3C) system Middle Component 3
MTEPRHFTLAWGERPGEEAAHFNPAFCGELIVRTLSDYHKQSGSSLPLAFAFLVLPLALHPATRRVLPRKANTAFASWAGEHADVLSTVPDRVLRLRPVSREALLFLSLHNAISIAKDGLSIGGQPLRLKAKPMASTEEVDEIRRTAGLLGRWFGNQTAPAAVLQTMGVRV